MSVLQEHTAAMLMLIALTQKDLTTAFVNQDLMETDWSVKVIRIMFIFIRIGVP